MGIIEFKDKLMKGCHIRRSGKSEKIVDVKLIVTAEEAPPYGAMVLMDIGLHDDGGCLVMGNLVKVSYWLRRLLSSYFIITMHI